jgi:hypothetical protein
VRPEVAKQIKQAAKALASDSHVRLLENYESQGTGERKTTAISVFDFSLFVQCAAHAAARLSIEHERSGSYYESSEPDLFIEALGNLRKDTVGLNTVIY